MHVTIPLPGQSFLLNTIYLLVSYIAIMCKANFRQSHNLWNMIEQTELNSRLSRIYIIIM